MEENKKQLLKKFKEITKLKWVEGINQGTNSVGLTFEILLQKDIDSMYFPDYYGIEIKCTQRFSRYPVNLFSISFDGPRLYEMDRLLKKYGISDKKYFNKLQLQGSIYVNKYNKINNNYFKLKVNQETKKIIICVYDKDLNLLEEETYIDFETIKLRLILKLSNLAVVYASKKKENDKLNFRYYKITIYKLKSFDRFIRLLEQDYISVSLIGRVTRSGKEEGRQRNKNLVFSIPKELLELLFEKELEYNADTDNKFMIQL